MQPTQQGRIPNRGGVDIDASQLSAGKNPMKNKYHNYKSIEDFLISHPLNIDAELNDGWGAYFPVKGIELEATILFADIASFSKRTKELSPIETLIFVNNFFAWMSAEGLQESCGLIDKYIGDEMMIVFSNEFGSENHFEDALRCARGMIDRDSLVYAPHIGIASGNVAVGYTGTTLHYNASVFGWPVTMAARCASVKSERMGGGSIIFPESNWSNQDIDKLFPKRVYKSYDGTATEQPQYWAVLPPRTVPMKNMEDTSIIELKCGLMHATEYTATQRAKDNFEGLMKNGFYRKFITKNKSSELD